MPAFFALAGNNSFPNSKPLISGLDGSNIVGLSNQGIEITNGSSGTYQNNTIKNNTTYGIINSGSTFVDATNCDWGDPTGPYDPSDDRSTGGLYNPNGKGNKVSDHVNYDPWVGKTQAVLSVTPTSRSVAKEAGTTTFSVSNTGAGTMAWTSAVSTGGSWLRITSGTSGSNAGTIACAFDANTGTSARTGTIRVTATGATGTPKDVTITQAGTPAQTKSKFLGVWSDGVYVWNSSTNQWKKIASTSGVSMIAAGKVDSDATEDLIGVWSSGLYVRQSSNGQWLKLSATLPTWIAAGDLNNDGRDDIIGTWKGDGVYCRDSVSGKWTKLSTPARQLATGNIHGDGRDDLVGVWDGIWARYSATAVWQKIDAGIPIWMATGDMTGSGRFDVVGSYSTATWYRNSATGSWGKITTPAEQLACGDIDGDGRDDLIGIWSNAVWVRYGATGKWQQISSSKPKWITTGRISEALQTADSLEDPIELNDKSDVVDLSQEGPGGSASDMIFLEQDGPAPAE